MRRGQRAAIRGVLELRTAIVGARGRLSMRWLDGLLAARRDARRARQRAAARCTAVVDARAHDAFRVQYLAVTAVLLVLLALRRRWAPAPSSSRRAPSAPRRCCRTCRCRSARAGQRSPGAPLKVLTVNVSYRPFSARRLLEIVRETDPDVLIVQELTPHAESVLAELDTAFPYHRKFPADGAVRHRPLVTLDARIERDVRARPACPRSKHACTGRRARSPSSACT